MNMMSIILRFNLRLLVIGIILVGYYYPIEAFLLFSIRIPPMSVSSFLLSNIIPSQRLVQQLYRHQVVVQEESPQHAVSHLFLQKQQDEEEEDSDLFFEIKTQKEHKDKVLSSSSINYEKQHNHHPTFYQESPSFLGPFTLQSQTIHQRIRHYSKQQVHELLQQHEQQQQQQQSSSKNDDKKKKQKNQNEKQKHVYFLQNEPKILPLIDVLSTQMILQTIVHALIYYNVPIDVKEVVESIEFVLRSKNRLIHSTRQHFYKLIQQQQEEEENEKIEIHIHDLCAGHGLTGILFAVCLYHSIVFMLQKNNTLSSSSSSSMKKKRIQPSNRIISLHVSLVDIQISKVFPILKSTIQHVCPWIKQVQFNFYNVSLEHYFQSYKREEKEKEKRIHLVVAIHACGSLTDDILHYATRRILPPLTSTTTTINRILPNTSTCMTSNTTWIHNYTFDTMNTNSTTTTTTTTTSSMIENNTPPWATAIAIIPCCYTGTDRGMPYGLQRVFTTSWNADIRRCLYLQDAGYHVDFGCIPKEITPMNRILFGEI